MSKKRPVVVTITKTNYEDQPWKFAIDDTGPGPHVTVKGRYADRKGAKKGALRKLKAVTALGDSFNQKARPFDFAWFTPKGNPIVFKYTTSKRKKK